MTVIMPQDGAAVPIRDRFTAVENAWAQWRKATEKASFAAVADLSPAPAVP